MKFEESVFEKSNEFKLENIEVVNGGYKVTGSTIAPDGQTFEDCLFEDSQEICDVWVGRENLSINFSEYYTILKID